MVIGTGFAVLLTGGLIGVSIGTFLHRPVLGSVGWAVALALAALLAVILLPPVEDVLRDLDHGATDSAFRFLVVVALLIPPPCSLAAMIADRRRY